MGQSESRDREFFIDVIKYTLKKKGIKVNTSQLTDFLQFVQTVSPWLPERGSLNVDTWEKVGLDIKNWFSENGGKGMPLTAFAIWNVLKETLADERRALGAQEAPDSPPCEGTPLLQSHSGSKKCLNSLTEKSEKSSSGESNGESEEERSTSEEESDSEKIVTMHHKHKWPTMQHLNISHSTKPPEKGKKKAKGPIGSAAGVIQAQQQDKLLGCFPVSMQNNKEDKDPFQEPLAFKLLMTPHDWFKIARAYLTRDEFLQWMDIFKNLAQKELSKMSEKKKGVKELTYEMFMDTGEWFEVRIQQKFTKEALVNKSAAALEAWRGLLNRDTNTKGLAYISQDPEELFEEFVTQLKGTVESMALSPEAKEIVLKQLVFMNTELACQSLLKTIKKSENLSKVEVATSYFQGVPTTTTSQGQNIIQNLTNKGQKKFNKSGFAHKSYSNKRPGPISKQCPNKAGDAINLNAPDLTQSRNSRGCHPNLKGYHWRKECQTNFHKNRTALSGTTIIPKYTKVLSSQKNCVRDLPQAPQTLEVIQQPQVTKTFVKGLYTDSTELSLHKNIYL
ncbi:endogenous retrovirus group K member 5 Gag polyprotein-like [Arvicanthis niloticus]|uniref:endogenous retrovirus group K member 5 Gag polyprotein-like n=1 Tax=Arvicanthis niloticus TaxID=61156 RepID=UPI00402B78BD